MCLAVVWYSLSFIHGFSWSDNKLDLIWLWFDR